MSGILDVFNTFILFDLRIVLLFDFILELYNYFHEKNIIFGNILNIRKTIIKLGRMYCGYKLIMLLLVRRFVNRMRFIHSTIVAHINKCN